MIITEYVTEKNYNPCGSMYTQIFRTGKTEKIAINNILNKKYFEGFGHKIINANIYNVSNVYNRNTYKLLEVVKL